jgi:hypothetical protein
MSDFDAGGAAAPADSAPVSAPEAEAVVTPNPVSTEREPTPEPAKAEPEKPLSTREALAKAAEKVNAADKPDDKTAPVKSEGPARTETGKFAPKDGEPAKAVEAAKPVEAPKAVDTAPQPASDAPARFSADAKAAWTTAPEPVKAEVTRAIKEMEAGIEKHRASAEAFEPVRKYADMAREGGTTLDKALEAYVGMENMLRADPIKGLNAVCENMGLSLRDVAAHIMGQAPDQQASQSASEVRELKAELAAVKQQLGGVTQTFASQREAQTVEQITAFASQPEHSRFEELADDITFFLTSGRTKDLAEAYRLAERLNPAPASAPANEPAAIPAPAPDLSAQTRKGSLSITGAPSPGSDPANRQPSPSIRDAIRRAAAQAG